MADIAVREFNIVAEIAGIELAVIISAATIAYWRRAARGRIALFDVL